MSGIAGIVRKDGSSVDAGSLEALTATLDHRGPDGSGIALADTAGFGQQRLYTTPESKHEETPRAEENLLFTADARIDNRAELLDSLDVRAGVESEDGEPGVVTDADLIVAAYEKWGTQCPERLVGAYAFALWDRKRERLFCARDHVGIKPFFFFDGSDVFVFGSELGTVRSHAGVSRSLDDRAIGDFLLGICDERDRTVYSDVSRLPPAHRLVVSEDGTRMDHYWNLDPDRELELDSTEAYVEGFRRRFDEAVRCRLRTTDESRLGSLLSGGLDSSSIACTAGESLQAPLSTFSLTFESIPEADERECIEAVLDHGEFDPEFVPGDEHTPMECLDAMLDRLDRPFVSNNLYMHWELYRHAASSGVDVLLDGHGGDMAVSYGARRLPELALDGRVLTLYREVSALAKRYGNPRRRLFDNEVVGPLTPTSVERLRRRFQSVPDPATRRVASLDPGFVGTFDLRERYRTVFEETYLSERRDHYETLSNGSIQEALEVADTAAATFGLEPRYPFFDRRLLEYSLALPSELKLRDGWSRWVLRTAMEGTLPSKIQWRLRKADLSYAFRDGLRRDRDRIRDLLDGLDDVRYVDPDEIHQSYVDFENNDNRDVLSTVWRPTLLLQWLEPNEPQHE
jgi:asparagine synthase (glutamine-hydrolysing)